MKTLKTLTLAALTGASFALSLPGIAQAMDHGSHGKTGATAKPTSPADMADGEIKKIDKDNKKLTIKHGEIKNLDMPGMTMVFQVRDEALLNKVKPGDAVKFHVEKQDGALVVTEIEPVP